MGQTSAIEWTDATWNPWMGCEKVSHPAAGMTAVSVELLGAVARRCRLRAAPHHRTLPGVLRFAISPETRLLVPAFLRRVSFRRGDDLPQHVSALR